MKEAKKKKDVIIKLFLIVIIILLLIHNCTLLKKKGKDKVPSGNVNIIEIICDNSDKCDIEDNKDTKNSDENDTSGNDSVDGHKTESGLKTTDENNSTNQNQKNNEEATTSEEDDVDSDDGVIVMDSKLVWGDTSQLKIFTNSVYDFEDKIAPEMGNTYQFVVKNSTRYNIKYNISFIENNAHHINMKYKLKKNDNYLVDHYVSYDELNISDQLLNSQKNDTYYLEWKWISSENDTEVGNIAASYSLKIDVKAESING